MIGRLLASASRGLARVSIRTKLTLILLTLLLLSVSALFVLHLLSERRLLSEVRDYTDELSTTLDIAQEQPASEGDRQAAVRAYAEKLKRLGVKDVAITDVADEVQAATNPAMVGKRVVRKPRRGQEWVIRGVIGDEPAAGGQRTSTLRVPLLYGDQRVGTLLVTRSVDDFSELAGLALRERIYATVLVFGVGIVAALLLAGTFTRPLQELSRASRQVAAGDLAARVPADGSDEIGELSRTFNEMVERLRENRALEERLHFAERSTALGRLASAVAHEIRNPLNFINLSIDHVRSRLAPEDAKKREDFDRILSSMKDEISRLNRLVVDFLSFGKPMRLDTRFCRLERVLRDVAALVDHKARDQGIALAVEAEPGLPEIAADPELLKTCFLNLLINAADAMPGGGTLSVTLRRGEDKGAEALVVTMVDSGHGMTPDEIRTAFEPYFSTKETGLGLGLALTRKIVEDHGGSITLESEPGKGTTARIALPLAARQAPVEPSPAAA
jgi:signal transduction histidine kinase